jgi:hypothetical protein
LKIATPITIVDWEQLYKRILATYLPNSIFSSWLPPTLETPVSVVKRLKMGCSVADFDFVVVAPGDNSDSGNFFEDFGVWKSAPILTGSTKFEPLPDVKNIMITGGAGFM